MGRLAHWGLGARRRHDPAAGLAVAPLAVFASYRGNTSGAVEAALSRLEDALGLARAESGYERLLTCARAVAEMVEGDEGLEPAPDLDLNVRINRVYAAATTRLADKLELELPAHAAMPRRLRLLMAAIPDDDTDEEAAAVADDLRRHAARLQAFAAAREGCVSAWPSVERILDQLERLEREVFGLQRRAGEFAGGDTVRLYGKRVAHVRAAAAILVGEREPAWRVDRAGEAAALTSAAHAATLDLLGKVERETTQPLAGFL